MPRRLNPHRPPDQAPQLPNPTLGTGPISMIAERRSRRDGASAVNILQGKISSMSYSYGISHGRLPRAEEKFPHIVKKYIPSHLIPVILTACMWVCIVSRGKCRGSRPRGRGGRTGSQGFNGGVRVRVQATLRLIIVIHRRGVLDRGGKRVIAQLGA
jgi:hypothetical protein